MDEQIQKLQDEIDKLYREIDTHNYWIEQSSNPMKLRRRYRDIKNTKQRIKELQELINQLRNSALK